MAFLAKVASTGRKGRPSPDGHKGGRGGVPPNSLATWATTSLTSFVRRFVNCRRCPRLVAWREQVAAERRAAYSGEQYWGRPIPGFGDHSARLAVVGLAPAAHGGNRTGRVFTGDRSGDWLWAALWRAGLASQPQSVSRDDGLRAVGVWVTATVKCARPEPAHAARTRHLSSLSRARARTAARREGATRPRRVCL